MASFIKKTRLNSSKKKDKESHIFGNIRSTTFREIWEEAKRFTIDNPYCYKCPGRGGLDAGEKAFVYGFVSNALNLSVQ
jgi:MoaA/NifB/PqqE/SkfB family radical SAM enzyme